MHPALRQMPNRLCRFSCVFLASLVTVAQLSRAQTFNTIYSFSGPNGRNPYAGLTIAPGGALYGATMLGGTGCAGNNGVGCGTAVYLTPPAQGGAWSETVLYSFGSRAGDTIEPDSTLELTPGGTLFGTSMTGGANGIGTVFELANPGGVWTEHVIHDFVASPGYPGGGFPMGVVASPTGVLYGTAEVGGANGAGLVFELAPPAAAGEAWTYTVLYNFTGQSGDGYAPYGPPILRPNGTLFGTTLYGGTGPCALDPTVTGCGTVFELSPPEAPERPGAKPSSTHSPARMGTASIRSAHSSRTAAVRSTAPVRQGALLPIARRADRRSPAVGRCSSWRRRRRQAGTGPRPSFTTSRGLLTTVPAPGRA